MRKRVFLRKILSKRPGTLGFVRPLVVTVILGFVFAVSFIPRLSADQNMPQEDEATLATDDVIDMITGDIQTVETNGLTRVSVTDPEIADISDTQSDKVTLLGKKAGETILFIWDAGGKRSIKIRVFNEDLSSVRARVEKVLDEANIKGLSVEENPDIGKVVISGDVSKEDKDRLEFALESDHNNILNLTKEEKSQALIQVDMQIVEISTTLEKNLGILWGGVSSGSTSGSSSSSSGSTGTTSNSNAGSVSLNYNENLPGGDTFGDLFKIGNFQRTTPLVATVNALIQEGKARLISKPRLVVVSGKQASFLVGGEIPVETTTTNTTGNTLTQNTTYTQYGVNLTVTPTVHNHKIDVLLNVDIRDIDAANSSNGNTAFITRTASTDLLMDNKQTVALAGLIKYSDSEQVTKVPFLGDLPILGALFRNRQTPSPDSNTEMVIILTPSVLSDEKFAENQVVIPTPEENSSWNEFKAKYRQEPLVSAWPDNTPKIKIQGPPIDSTAAMLPLTTYARMVQEKISKAISYPQEAGNTMEGTVKLKLHILKDGSLDSEEVMESSGNDILDQDAMQAAKSAAPFSAFTEGMDEEDMIFTIPIIYNKLTPASQAPAEKVIASY